MFWETIPVIPKLQEYITQHHYRRQWNVPFTLWWTVLVEVFRSAMSVHIFRMDDSFGNQHCDRTLTNPKWQQQLFPAAIVRWITDKCYVINQGVVLVDKKATRFQVQESMLLCSSLTRVSEWKSWLFQEPVWDESNASWQWIVSIDSTTSNSLPLHRAPCMSLPLVFFVCESARC